MAEGLPLRILKGHTKSVSSVAFSQDGHTICSGGYDGTVRIWRVNDGQLLKTLNDLPGRVETVAFDADGTRLAAGSWRFDNSAQSTATLSTLGIWETSDYKLLKSVTGDSRSVGLCGI